MLERPAYTQLVFSLLQDPLTYKRLAHKTAAIETSKLETALYPFLNNKKHQQSLEADENTYLRCSLGQLTVHFSHFYIIAKIHKTPWKPWLIVSYCGSLLYGLGKWLDAQLQSIARPTPAYISSSFDLFDQTKKIKIEPLRFSVHC